MQTDDTPPPLDASSEPPMSLAARLLNVYATPGDVFEEVRGQPLNHANWLVPWVLACVMGILSVILIFSQPAIMHQLQEQQEKALDRQAEKMKMSKQQADQIKAMAGRFMSREIMIASGSVAVVFSSAAMLFFLAFVVWILGSKLFKADFDYLKAVEVVGLAGMIMVLGTILNTLTVIAKGNVMMRLSPVLFLSDFNPANPAHALLSLLNLPMLWYLLIVSIALQKLGRTSLGKAATCVFGLAVIVEVPLALLGVLAQRLQ